MVKLEPNENRLTGEWIVQDNDVRGDATNERIKRLIEQHLKFITNSPQWGAWEVLYKDPIDGRYWELTYPKSEMQGGGPLQLEHIASEIASMKYHLTT